MTAVRRLLRVTSSLLVAVACVASVPGSRCLAQSPSEEEFRQQPLELQIRNLSGYRLEPGNLRLYRLSSTGDQELQFCTQAGREIPEGVTSSPIYLGTARLGSSYRVTYEANCIGDATRSVEFVRDFTISSWRWFRVIATVVSSPWPSGNVRSRGRILRVVAGSQDVPAKPKEPEKAAPKNQDPPIIFANPRDLIQVDCMTANPRDTKVFVAAGSFPAVVVVSEIGPRVLFKDGKPVGVSCVFEARDLGVDYVRIEIDGQFHRYEIRVEEPLK